MEGTKIRQFFDRLSECLRAQEARKALTALGSFVAGLLCARGLVFGRYAPFGVAAAAAVPRGGLWAAVLGAVLGYLLPSPVYISVRYVAALGAVAAIRWALSELKAVADHPLFAPGVAFAPLLLTGLTMVFLGSAVDYSAALYVAESFLGSGAAYFLRRSALLLTGRTGDGKKRAAGSLEAGDLAAGAVTAGLLALSISDWTVGGVSLGRILLVLMVLTCARVGGISGGAVAGVAAGAVEGLSTAGLSYLSGAYGLGGLMAGVFSPMGKIAGAVAFILAHGVASLQVGSGSGQILTGAVEVAAATVLYMVLPGSRRLAQWLGVRRDSLSGGALRDNIVFRLRYAAQALAGVSQSVDTISQKLGDVCAPDMQSVFDRAAETVCSGCGMRTVCWRKQREETLDALTGLSRVLREKSRVEAGDLPEGFAKRCSRGPELLQTLNRQYARHRMKEAAELRAAQVREAVEEHLKTTAGILEEMAGEFSLYQQFDEEAARRVEEVLENNGALPVEVCCRIDRFGRMTVEAEIRRERQRRLNRAVFTREVSLACGRTFSPPCLSATEDHCRIQMCQRPVLDVDRGFAQYNARSGAFCGDSTTVFYDGSGRLIALLSDGMGTGGRAAVDGAMTCAMAESLLKAGIGFDSMLQTVNQALMAKSGDESLSTLDLLCLDLFTGKAEFCKAGAACTVLRRGKRVETVEASSVPVGIMPGVEFARTGRMLDAGDVVVMVSDGVVAGGVEWLCDAVAGWDESENPNLLAQQLTDEARKRRADGHEDDVTALVLVIR